MYDLLVLLWKHWTVLKRRYILGPVELLYPLIFWWAFVGALTLLAPSLREAAQSVQSLTETFTMDELPAPSMLVYTPKTNYTSQLMHKVSRKLRLRILDNLTDPRGRGVYGANEDEDLTAFVTRMRDSHAIVVFRDMEHSIPERLNYTIRTRIDYMTHIYNSLDGDESPHHSFGTIYEPFIRLQWAIDSSYLELQTGNNINQRVSLQEFPYVDKKNGHAHIPGIIEFGIYTLSFYSLFAPFVIFMGRVMEERVTGLQELIKMTGVPLTRIQLSHVINVIPVGLVYSCGATVLLKTSTLPIIPQTNAMWFIFVLLMNWFILMALAFVYSFISNSHQFIGALSSVLYITTQVVCNTASQLVKKQGLVKLTGILPLMPLQWFLTAVEKCEARGKGFTMKDMFAKGTQPFIPFLFLQLILFSALSWYLSRVRPGKYGTPLRWNFCFKKKVKPQELVSEEQEIAIVHDPQYFEESPNKPVGIEFSNITKVYGKTRVLTNVSFNVYRGEITVLLGHNGAGKTTLMSIITGMVSATEGKVYIDGQDMKAHLKTARNNIGLCTQHNLFFPRLNILEHVVFFTMLKSNVKLKEAVRSSHEILQSLGIDDKAKNLPNELSGGMQRRLQLACALAGGSQVLILDEPTSGLDVETRRELWDLLLALRGSRTVLLTTHFMEEADALGDRVAALHNGVLRCHATPMFLKKNIGTGYRLTLSTIGTPNVPAITAAVTSQMPTATHHSSGPNEVTYFLPVEGAKFPPLFAHIESRREELGIEAMGVGMPTLEEVFLKLCSNVEPSFKDELDGAHTYTATKPMVTGFPLYRRQFVQLVKRHVLFIMGSKFSYLLLQLAIPLTILILMTYSVGKKSHEMSSSTNRSSSVSMDLDIYEPMPERRVLYNLNDVTPLRAIGDTYPNVDFEGATDVAKTARRASSFNNMEYNKYIAGVELNDTDIKVLFTTIVRHAAPVAVNLLSNILAAGYLPNADGHTISTYNKPLLFSSRRSSSGSDLPLQAPTYRQPKTIEDISLWVAVVMSCYLSAVAQSSYLSSFEREAGTRHIHVMAGCSPVMYWLTRLLFHLVLYVGTLVVPLMIVMVVTENTETFNQPDFLGAFFLICLLGTLSFLSISYVISFVLNPRMVYILLMFLILTFGVILALVKVFMDEIGSTSIYAGLLKICQYLVPPQTLSAGILNACHVARLNAYCDMNRVHCPMLVPINMDFDILKCCTTTDQPASYYALSGRSPAPMMLGLLIQTIILMVLVILMEQKMLNIFKPSYKKPVTRYNNSLVIAEKEYVSESIKLLQKQNVPAQDVMLVDDLHKKYGGFFGCTKVVNSVKGISFSVKKGECFGVLGVNGAGKSTTFKMIVGEVRPSLGRIMANGHMLDKQRMPYLYSLAYCPQFGGLDDFMTGAQNLRFVLTMHGLSERDMEAEVATWIDVVGMEQHQHKRVSGLSGGCARRMAAALAMSLGAPLTLLDEPTAGVDVAARRRVWRALRHAQRQQRAVIITSHSLDEMEALCDRIAIMSRGEVCALGSPRALRSAFALGHAVVLKLAGRDETDGASPVNDLKSRMNTKFDCTLKDEHATMLRYHINQTMNYSELFTQLEELKTTFSSFIEDYSVTETTLEEVFLSIAHEAADDKKETV